MSESKLYWIGIRESEIIDTGNLFQGSITIFGSNKNNNISYEQEHGLRIDYSQENSSLYNFVDKSARKILRTVPDAKFLLYYPMEVEDFGPIVLQHAICLNSSAITDLLENKLYTKLWLASFVPVIPFSTVSPVELDYDYITGLFPYANSVVLQETFSCGGSGTWLINEKNDLKEIKEHINVFSIYTITPYKQYSVPLNIHLVIYEKEIILFPFSVQIIVLENHKFGYNGADFIAARTLPADIVEKVFKYAKTIGTKLQAAGYRGICGIDFLSTSEEVYFMEINARFQSSSFLINEILKKNNCPCLQELNIEAFSCKHPSVIIPEITIDRSFYSYSHISSNFARNHYIWKLASDCPEIEYCIDDNLNWDIKMEYGTYLYKLVFNTNIISILPEYKCRLYNGLCNDIELSDDPWQTQLMALKTLLLNQGIRISDGALKELDIYGGPNYATFYAVDICIENTVYLNVPYRVKFSELSSFEIVFENNIYCLKYYDRFIARVTIRTADPLENRYTVNDIPYYSVAYLGVDRLRIHQRSGCYFKDKHVGCRFCGIDEKGRPYTFEDIKEILDCYLSNPSIRHFLVGGGSQDPSSQFQEVIDIADYIHQKTFKNIYLMSIPPLKVNILKKLKDVGITVNGR